MIKHHVCMKSTFRTKKFTFTMSNPYKKGKLNLQGISAIYTVEAHLLWQQKQHLWWLAQGELV